MKRTSMTRFKFFHFIPSGLIVLLTFWFSAPLLNQISTSSFALLDLILILFSGAAFALLGWNLSAERLMGVGETLSTPLWRGLEAFWFGSLSFFLLTDALFEPARIGWLFALFKLGPAVSALLAYSIVIKIRQICNERGSAWQKILKCSLWISLGLTLIAFGNIQARLSEQIYPVTEFITFPQAILIGLVGGLVAWLIRRRPLPGWLDAALFVLIWTIAAWLWVTVRLGSLPLGEGGVFIPAEDARVYDASASLIVQGYGQSLRFGSWANYSVFLAGLKYLVGMDPLATMRAQAALLGLIPALLYLLGRELGSRTIGLFSAALFIVSNFNLLTSSKSNLHISTLQTEPLMALGVVLMTLLFIRALKNPESRVLLVLFGGVAGFFSLVRVNALPFLFAPLVPFLFRKPIVWKKAAWALIAPGVGFLLIVSPSIIRNASLGYEPIYFSGKVKDLAHRMGFETWNSNEAMEGQTGLWAGSEPHDYQFSWQVVGARAFSIATYDLNFLPRLINDPTLRPNSNLAEHPFLRLTGFEINAFNSFSFLLNLLLIGLGIYRLYRAAGWAGLAPAIFYGAYYLTAVFSSSLIPRHVFPIAWVPPLYYPAGIWALIEAIRGSEFRQARNQPAPVHSGMALIGLVGILAASLAIPLTESLIPAEQTFKLKANGEDPLLPSGAVELLNQAGIQPGQVNSFMEREPSATLAYGPIFYPASPGVAAYGGGNKMTFAFFDTRLYPESVMETETPPSGFRHAGMVLMLYCEVLDEENLTDVAFITNGSATIRSPKLDLFGGGCP